VGKRCLSDRRSLNPCGVGRSRACSKLDHSDDHPGEYEHADDPLHPDPEGFHGFECYAVRGLGDHVLIINADDLGGSREATDAIGSCFDAGAITSATLMVNMTDSARAAELAREKGWPIGLHLNLTQAFDDPALSQADFERHRQVVAYFEGNLRQRRLWPEVRPAVRRLVGEEMSAQIDEFERVAGMAPTHIDSHHHSHTTKVVLSLLGRELPVRRTASRRGASIARRFKSTDYFMSFPEVKLASQRAETKSVELMVHPSFENELPVLLSDQWIETVAAADTGSFADLV
jgi:predicted glycoside hydrolase/deacetylase ChbG (UPF0249 family)